MIILALVAAIAMTTPVVQTYLAKKLTTNLKKEYKININVEEVAITVFGGAKLKKVLIRDHHNDTLIYAKTINTTITQYKKLLTGDLHFKNVKLNQLVFNHKQYKGEKKSNLEVFIEAFNTGKPATKKFLLTIKNASVANGRFILINENSTNPKNLDVSTLNSNISNLKVYGPEVTMQINQMSFVDYRGLEVKNLSSNFTYTKQNIILDALDLNTKESLIKGKVVLEYERKDFSDFNNKVKFNIRLDTTSIATNDISYFYKELGKEQRFNLKAEISGTLNDIEAKNLVLIDDRNSQIIGDVNFKNLFSKDKKAFYMQGNFEKVSSSYDNLIRILPNVLGKKLPTSMKKLGQFNLIGDAEITSKTIVTDFYLQTILGNIKSTIEMDNINTIDNASYKGNIVLENFNIGSFLNRKDVEKVSLDVDINGKGFTEKYLNTKFSGDIYKLKYNNYTYSKIIVDGMFKAPIFRGKVFSNDANLLMDFDGQVNFSKKDISYDFKTKIDYANLVKLNFSNDSTAVFKGDITMKVTGTNLDNIQGDIFIKQTAFQNNKENYIFDDFSIKSSFDKNKIRTISVNSQDIIEGKVVGKFEINQLRKMVENSLGSLYTNYLPNKVKPNQFLDFDFVINSKIIELFYPGISIANNTNFKGKINSDNDEFKLNFKSPKVTIFDNYLDNIQVEVDNKNPLFNTYITLDSIRTKQYKIRDFSMINVTTKDTLFLRSEFKGGPAGKDFYNLNLFHTINSQKMNVVGIQKSELMFKDYLWFLNEKDSDQNTVVFDKKFTNFSIDNIIMSHENQSIQLSGLFNGIANKDLKLKFDNIEIDRVLPTVNKFDFKGKLNGFVDLKQDNTIYKPTSSLKINDLFLNKIELGNLVLDIEGDNSFRSFNVNSTIENKNLELFSAKGKIDIAGSQTNMDLDLNFEDFNLGVLSSLAGNVLSNIRGLASGKASIKGNIKDWDMNGRLLLNNAGMGIPYLNVDYLIENSSIVDVTKNKFMFRPSTLKDTKFETEGKVSGIIEHKNFGDWKLDLNINSKRLLALDTKDSEDAAYFGQAFIDGSASIKGPISSLFIAVNAKSGKGTAIKIPINDSESTEGKSYIHFVTEEEKFNIKKGITAVKRNYNGLELEFDFDITPEAEIEVILDRNSGHGMKGKGFGSLLFKINTLGKFNMWGDFQAYEGTYNFKYGGIINKKFNVKKGGSISWEGDPLRAILNLEAVYNTSANPAALVNNESYKKKIPVTVTIGLTGNLTNPEPDFKIDFPNVSNVLKTEIQTKLDDKDVRQKQAIVLLSTGSFLSDVGGLSQSTIGKDLIYDKVSDMFGSIFRSDSKLGVGIDLKAADKISGTDGSVGLILNYKISDRITFNGKAGIPIGGINQSAIVGNAEIQYRVNEDGTLNLLFFNKESDINYFGQNIGYTQGLGISYEVDFDTFQELVHKIFKNQKIEKNSNPDDEIPDSDNPIDIINTTETNKKKKDTYQSPDSKPLD